MKLKSLLTIGIAALAIANNINAAALHGIYSGFPPLVADHGGSGRAVSLRDRGTYVDVRHWTSPGVSAGPRAIMTNTVHVAETMSFDMFFQGGHVLFRDANGGEGDPVWDFNINLYEDFHVDDCIMLWFPTVTDAYLDVWGWPWLIFDNHWVMINQSVLVPTTITFYRQPSTDEIVRICPVRVYTGP